VKPRSNSTRAILLLGLSAVSFATPVEMPAFADDVQSQINAGKRTFVVTCANCHGATAGGALGPSLVNRRLAPEIVRNTILNGRVGSAMPQFKGDLDAASLAAVIAYVMWLESGGTQPQVPVSEQDGMGDSGAPSVTPISIGQESGVPARGAELFFDATRICSCRTCHSFKDKGGPVGPDLATLKISATELYRNLDHPVPLPAVGFRAIAVNLRDGRHLRGIQSDESAAQVAFFDVSSCPPVKRTFSRSEILDLSAISRSGVFDHRALGFSKQALLDLSAYLGN
jgi:putative heme-binding domain-containing protein